MQYPLSSYIIAFIFPAFVLLMALCYLIGRPKPENKLIGFRTVRTLSSPAAWKRGQYLFGRQLLIGGIVAGLFGYGFLDRFQHVSQGRAHPHADPRRDLFRHVHRIYTAQGIAPLGPFRRKKSAACSTRERKRFFIPTRALLQYLPGCAKGSFKQRNNGHWVFHRMPVTSFTAPA